MGELVATILEHWPGAWLDQSDPTAPHEANLLHLQIDKAHHRLGWQPRWDYGTTLARTVGWYRAVDEGANPFGMPHQAPKAACSGGKSGPGS